MSGFGGLMAMIGPMAQGMVGSSFQPGTKAQQQANQAIQDKYSQAQGRQQQSQQASGWDQFLTGAGQFGANISGNMSFVRGFWRGKVANTV